MTVLRRQQTSVDAYLALMEKNGADADNLARRRALLDKLMPFLAQRPVKGEFFRNAVDEAMPLIEKTEWPFFMTVVRDFYYFWVNDFKMIAAMQKSGSFQVNPALPTPPEGNLKTLWESLATEKFSLSEKWPINAYKAALRDEGIEQDAIDTRAKMAQLLLLQLRKIDGKDGHTYRLAVESMLPVFLKKETSELFIAVVREFFHFWLGDPNAPDNLSSSESLNGPNTLW